MEEISLTRYQIDRFQQNFVPQNKRRLSYLDRNKHLFAVGSNDEQKEHPRGPHTVQERKMSSRGWASKTHQLRIRVQTLYQSLLH